MKNPLAWHKECLKHKTAHYASLLRQIERLKEDYARGQKAINEYDAQIIRAEEMGLTEFDREKFGKKKPRDAASHADNSTKEKS